MKLINKKEEKKMNIVTKVVMIIVFVIMCINVSLRAKTVFQFP